MLFEEELLEDKGLFTFYREEADREAELKKTGRLKKVKKNTARGDADGYEPFSFSKSPDNPPAQEKPKCKVVHAKFNQFKQKPNIPKQKYVQSIVDLSKQIVEETEERFEHLTARIKSKQPSYILKNRKCKEKIVELNQSLDHQPLSFREQPIPEEIKIASYHHRNQSMDLGSSRSKAAAIHSARSSIFELPQIKKPEMPPYKPKKSIKSKLIQDALKLKDKQKIKQIREHFKACSNIPNIENQKDDLRNEFDVDDNSFVAFQKHQHRLLGILKKFRKGL